jgi:hypothetical protein
LDGGGRGRQVKLNPVAAIVNEGEKIFLVVGPGDHTSQRYELSKSLADKLEYELATIRIMRRIHSEGTTT